MKTLKRAKPAVPMVLGARTATDLMTPNPISLREDAHVKDAVALLVDKGYSAAPVINEAGHPVGVLSRSDILVRMSQLALRAQPIPLAAFRGPGLYLRTDYWNASPADDRMRRVVAQLSSNGDRVVCLTPGSDTALEQSGVQQVVMDPPRLRAGEDAIVLAPTHYWPIVKAACQTLRPAFLYDRLSAGQSVGAELSQVLGIPYIVEYRGANAVVREALNGAAPFYPELYAEAEELALRQATVVVAVSTDLERELIARGIDASRILVSPPDGRLAASLTAFVVAQSQRAHGTASIETGDAYKDQIQNQWNQNPVGSHHAREAQPHTLDWFLEIERQNFHALVCNGDSRLCIHKPAQLLHLGGFQCETSGGRRHSAGIRRAR